MKEVKELKFKVGDKVTAKLAFGTFKGKVVYVSTFEDSFLPYLVQFKKENSRFHDGNGQSDRRYKPFHCYWCREDVLIARTRDTDFNVGDKVKIRSWKAMEKEFGLNGYGSIDMPHGFVDSMKPLCGCTATILSMKKNGCVDLEFGNDGNNDTRWIFGIEMLKKVKGKEPKEKVFENGKTYKFDRKLYMKDFGYDESSCSTWAYECDGKVVSVFTKDQGKIDLLIVHRDWCVECEPEEPKPYNGKVVCVDLCGLNTHNYTVGKIYQFENGIVTTDCGGHMGSFSLPFKSFEEFNNFSGSNFVEVVE